MKEFNEIDKLFQEQAQGFRAKVPDGSWDRISQTLNSRKKRFGLWFYSSMVAAILVFTGIGYFAFHSKSPKSNQIAQVTQQQNQIVTQNQELSKSPDVSDISTLENKINSNTSTSTSIAKVEAKSQNSTNISSNNISNKPTKKIQQSAKVTTKVNKNRKLIQKTIHVSEAYIYPQQLDEKSNNVSANSSLIQNSEKSIIASKSEIKNDIERKMEEKEIEKSTEVVIPTSEVEKSNPIASVEEKNPTSAIQSIETLPKSPKIQSHNFMSFAFFAGVSYSYRTSDKVATKSEIPAKTQSDDWLNAAQTKLEVQFNLTDKISVSTGIQNGKFGSISNFKIRDEYFKYVKINEFGIASSGFFNANRIASVLNSANAASVNSIKKFDRIKVVFNYIDYPLTFRYSFYEKWGVKARAGLGFNLAKVNSNLVSIRKDELWYDLGTVENTREYLFGMNSGLELAYLVGRNKNLELLFVSDYRYYFHSINLDTDFIYRPYIFSMSLGMRILF